MEQVSRSDTNKEIKKTSIEKLLPNAEELKPIDKNSAFADCGFDKGKFQDLPVRMQLKIACDIVRQANLIDYWPSDESPILSGDCSTTAEWLKKYINKLKVPGDVQLAAVRRNPFDGDWKKSTTHIIVLHKDTEGNYRTVDPTTMIGYGYGTVGPPATFENNRITSVRDGDEQIYEDIVLMNESDIQAVRAINNLRSDFYIKDNATIESSQETINFAKKAVSGNHMDSWLSEAYYVLAVLQEKKGLKQDSRQSITNTIKLNPLKPKVLEMTNISEEDRKIVEATLKEYKETTLRVSSNWQEMATDIFRKKDKAKYQDAVRYTQWAFRELKSAGEVDGKKPSIPIGGKSVYLYNINPRILSENGLTVVWIKPNSSIVGAYAAAREAITVKGRSIFKYDIDLTEPLDQETIPLTLSHPHGERKQNVLAFGGPTSILLVNNSPLELEGIKIKFRDSWGKNLRKVGSKGKETRWFDDEKITWDSVLTNYIHTTDTSAEAVVHLLVGFPHLSLVNRWDYPHPNL